MSLASNWDKSIFTSFVSLALAKAFNMCFSPGVSSFKSSYTLISPKFKVLIALSKPWVLPHLAANNGTVATDDIADILKLNKF